jgi:hypothetical protein
MTSLSEVYEGGINTVADPGQRRVGMALFATGVGMVVAAIAVATTDLSALLGLDVIGARALAGVLAGLGIPGGFVGLFVVLPATDATRAAAAVGASLAVFGVVLFAYAYPDRWLSADPLVAVATVAVYALGTLLTLWSLFISVATFNRRQGPGGTARIEITKEGNVRLVSAAPESTAGGSVGLFGSDPDGSVPTQTNSGSADDRRTGREPTTEPRPTGDGSGAVAEEALVDDEIVKAANERGRPDRYCGNCAHFEYVRADGEIAPYCARHSELMDDMDACEQWEENR